MAKEVLMCGNEIIAESALLAGCRFYAGYPITPQNELIDYMSKRMTEVGGIFIQSESELSAINMCLGASAAGARAMTSSSSPGISLKQEGISYIAGSQLPVVIVNIMRGGPGLGNIAPSQADYFQATKGGGHGDYHLIVLAPASVGEMAELTYEAFDMADKYRNPVMILGDGILGQMMEPARLDFKAKRRLPKKDWALDGNKTGKQKIVRSFFLDEGALERHNKMLQEKYKKIKQELVKCQTQDLKNSDIILVAYGTASRIARSAIEKAKSLGIKCGLIRPITLWPFPEKIISDAADKNKEILVVEMSAGQMVEDVRLAVNGKTEVHFFGRTGGGVPSVEEIVEEIKNLK